MNGFSPPDKPEPMRPLPGLGDQDAVSNGDPGIRNIFCLYLVKVNPFAFIVDVLDMHGIYSGAIMTKVELQRIF